MAYEGKLLDKCYDDMFDFSDAEVVVVSGDGPNRYGHMLLKAGSNYFQVVMGGFAGIYATPRYMDQDGYQRFLRESGKTPLFRYRVKIPEPQKSQLKLEQLLSQPRWWGGLTHNCEGLVENIIVAGGGPKIHKGLMMLPTLSRPHSSRPKPSPAPPAHRGRIRLKDSPF